MAKFDDKNVKDPHGLLSNNKLQANLPTMPPAGTPLNAGMEGVLRTVQTEFADLRKKANTQLNASIAGAIQEVHKFLGTGSYIKGELSQLAPEHQETKDLINEQVTLGERQQAQAVAALTKVTKDNYLVGESVVAGVQAREAVKAIQNASPAERSSMVKDAVAQYDTAVKQLREYVS